MVAHDPDDIALNDMDLDEFDLDPERLQECEYWRCGDLFEARSAAHRFCRKACRSRHHKWQRAQARKARRAAKTKRSPHE